MPLFVWSLYATAWIQVLVTPIIGITLVLVILERFFGVGVFDPAKGGDPLLYQHMFWIYSHPAVYIMIVPAMGAITEIIPTFSHKTIFGYKAIAYSSHRHRGLRLHGLGAPHVHQRHGRHWRTCVFSLFTFIVAVPSAIKVFNWTATLYKGSIEMAPAMLYALTLRIPLRHRGLDRRHPGRAGHQHPPARHLLDRRAISTT